MWELLGCGGLCGGKCGAGAGCNSDSLHSARKWWVGSNGQEHRAHILCVSIVMRQRWFKMEKEVAHLTAHAQRPHSVPSLCLGT